MKINDFLTESTKILNESGIGTARLDALILLEDILNQNRAWVLAHPETVLQTKTLRTLEKQIEKRKKHIPIAQILGKTEFYGRIYIINEHVLEPRPESETMIDLLKQILGTRIQEKGYRIIDVGTGSGALAVTAKLELPQSEVAGIDIDLKCLVVAKKNATKLNADVTFYKGDLLEPVYSLNPLPCILLCNLPYVPETYEINQAAMNEPRLAIFGGEDGLDVYKRLFEQISDSETKPVYLCCESLPFQHQTLELVAQKSGYKQLKAADLIQIFELMPISAAPRK